MPAAAATQRVVQLPQQQQEKEGMGPRRKRTQNLIEGEGKEEAVTVAAVIVRTSSWNDMLHHQCTNETVASPP